MRPSRSPKRHLQTFGSGRGLYGRGAASEIWFRAVIYFRRKKRVRPCRWITRRTSMRRVRLD